MKPNFQLVLIIIFIAAAVFGVLVFSGAIKIGSDGTTTTAGNVVLWGTVPTAEMAQPLASFNDVNKSFTVTYVEKRADTFDQDLLEALASGTGPDLFLLPDDLVYHYSNKIFTVPYSSFPLASFKSTFAGAGEVFLSGNGLLAFPLTIDPLMMYYNRNILDANAIVYPPGTWEDLSALVPKLTTKDDKNKITQTTVALGQFSNVMHAKDILVALFEQAGNPIVKSDGSVRSSVLDQPIGKYTTASMLQFYTNFADPNNLLYSWNKSFPSSDQAFSSETAAFYFGFASELQDLVNKNPNENFFVASFPQIKDSNFKSTAAHVTGIAISASSKNLTTAFAAASSMATSDFANKLALATGTAPARRDLLAQKPANAFSPIFYDSALYAKSWPDPSPKDTDNIWSVMVNAVLSGSMNPTDAVRDASSKLQLLLLK